MASYDSETGIHIMTLNEALDYLRGLPSNTTETPYKIKITNIDLSNTTDRYTLNNIAKEGGRYLDLSYTEISITSERILNSVFVNCNFLIHSPVFNNKNNIMYTMENTFLYCRNLNTVPNIPNSVTNMTYTFYGCTNLKTIPNIPDSVTSMKWTFYYCVKLETIPNIPNSVTDMEATFYGCTNLKTIPNIPDSVTNMAYAFEDCVKLETIPNIPDSVTNMAYAFEDCVKLETIPNIPNSVTNMTYTFYGCTNLKTIPNIPDSVTDMACAFSKCTNLKTIPNIPSGVTNMTCAFEDCVKLETVHLIEGIDFSKINMRLCFKNCPNLKEFICDVNYEENDDWILYLLKRIDNNLNVKRYNINTNKLIDDKTISLGNVGNELDLISKTDELLIDSAGNITDQQINLLLENKIEFGNKYSLDPSKKWLVVWADNPYNVRSNCFVTQRELQELKAKLKTYHPDLF